VYGRCAAGARGKQLAGPRGRRGPAVLASAAGASDMLSWRMPPLSELTAPAITGARRIGLIGLRAYLAVAMVMVIVKIIQLATGH